jgi:hypothetical protein
MRFSMELGEEVSNITSNCRGKPFKSVCGSIKKGDDARAVYFATLQTGHADITLGLTVSVGRWSDDSAQTRGPVRKLRGEKIIYRMDLARSYSLVK